MKKYYYLGITLLASMLTVFLMSCERDDICTEDTLTTPQLIVTFYDIDNPEELKSVESLRITDEDGANIYTTGDRTTRDSIAIPLRILSDLTSYQFIVNSEDDDSDMEIGNTDLITFQYTTEEIFLSRACGYIANFTLNETDGVSITTDTDNWIDPVNGIEIVNANIQDETSAHVKIYH